MSTSSPSNENAEGSTFKRRPLDLPHGRQVQSILDAIEDVEIDSDTIDELFEGQESEDDRYESDGDTLEVSLDVSDRESTPLFLLKKLRHDEDESHEILEAWTKDEINTMMYHLKEFGAASFIKEYVTNQNIPIPKLLYAFRYSLCKEMCEKSVKTQSFFLQVAMTQVLRSRDKLPHYNTAADAVSLIQRSRRIVILTGAGISVSCGIPDFRSRNGLYSMLKERGDCDLDDPQQMFDIHYFRENPSGIFISPHEPLITPFSIETVQFFREIYPSNFIPSPCHRFIKLVEQKGKQPSLIDDADKLLRNYTQNIDTLEIIAGISNVIQCHGSFRTASCLECRRQVPGIEIEQDILACRVPYCSVCVERRREAEAEERSKKPKPRRKSQKKKGKTKRSEWEEDSENSNTIPPPGVMKPDITFFGEKLTDDFDRALSEDRNKVDLLLVIGTSLEVAPVSGILYHLPHSVPQIVINKTPIKHINPDIVLLGNADEIVQYLCAQLNWDSPSQSSVSMTLSPDGLTHQEFQQINKRPSDRMLGQAEPRRVGNSHVWLFEGAEGGQWVRDLEKQWIPEGGTQMSRQNATVEFETQKRNAKKMRL